MTQPKHIPHQKATPFSGAVFNKELYTAQGGRFGLGFISAFTSSLALSYTTGKSNNPLAIMGMGAAIGGTAEALGGGKFANGAVTGAFVALFNDMMHSGQQSERFVEFDNRDDAYDYLKDLETNNGKEYAGFHFKNDSGDDLFVIDLESPDIDNPLRCNFFGDVPTYYSGYKTEGLFHNHPAYADSFGTTSDINAMKVHHASYQDIVLSNNRVHRYYRTEPNYIRSRFKTIGSESTYIPDKVYWR